MHHVDPGISRLDFHAHHGAPGTRERSCGKRESTGGVPVPRARAARVCSACASRSGSLSRSRITFSFSFSFFAVPPVVLRIYTSASQTFWSPAPGIWCVICSIAGVTPRATPPHAHGIGYIRYIHVQILPMILQRPILSASGGPCLSREWHAR